MIGHDEEYPSWLLLEKGGHAGWVVEGPHHMPFCRSAEAVVAGANPRCELSRRAVAKLEEIRERLAFVDGAGGSLCIVDNEQDSWIWTFGGGLANAALANAPAGSGITLRRFLLG